MKLVAEIQEQDVKLGAAVVDDSNYRTSSDLEVTI